MKPLWKKGDEIGRGERIHGLTFKVRVVREPFLGDL